MLFAYLSSLLERLRARPDRAPALLPTDAARRRWLGSILGRSGASQQQLAPPAASLHLATGPYCHRLTANRESRVLWTRRLGASRARVELSMELGVSAWMPHKDRESGGMWQLSAVPVWRFWASDESTHFIELGVGPSLLSRKRFAGRQLSTHFQFADHIGLGRRIGEQNRLGMRISHFSNASIKRPNPGLDVLQLLLWRRMKAAQS
ncbi:acyloxyacyl hydrolase [Roseateles sp. DAIF2]|uniref:acyloxyacyl hydrolase n=1 Tax=Roseateles sp. DAIF2 TaxID=2714952 RepID=UPI0018A316D9|nr:acyloxyacyl hydrolase [Roseateles sp. DAIF2]QPF72333.1 acyloxyacyl hydrolase [Roseateles sp. DAIF2]